MIDFSPLNRDTPNWLGLVHAGMASTANMARQRMQDDRAAELIAIGRADHQRATTARSALGDLIAAGSPPSRSQSTPSVPTAGTSLPGSPEAMGSGAFSRLAQADPERAIKWQGEQRTASKETLELYRDANRQAFQMMGGVRDQASYDATRDRVTALYARFGLDLSEHNLPDEYDPEVVRGLMLQSIEVDKQLAAQRADRRLDADIADDEHDNMRADRNTDSMISDRGARRGLTARGQNLSDARGRRGQDIASGDRRRGQDMTDRRIRETPRTARPATTGNRITRVAQAADGRKVGWNGTAWVPVK